VEWYWQEEYRSTLKVTCPSGILSTTNPTQNDLESNPCFSIVRPATKRFTELKKCAKPTAQDLINSLISILPDLEPFAINIFVSNA
jgi:hypothetical protein